MDEPLLKNLSSYQGKEKYTVNKECECAHFSLKELLQYILIPSQLLRNTDLSWLMIRIHIITSYMKSDYFIFEHNELTAGVPYQARAFLALLKVKTQLFCVS